MKKLYSILLTALAVVVAGFSASAANVTLKLDIDDASRVVVSVNRESVDCTNGMNSFTIDEYSSIMVKATEGNTILSVVNEDGVRLSKYSGAYSIYGYGNDGKTFTVTSASLAEIQTASFKLTVNGDVSDIEAVLMPLGTELVLQEGEQTVKFSPEYETYIAIESGDAPMYKVSVDGETIMSCDYECDVDLEEGIEIVVDQAFPDVDCTYTITFAEGAEECLTDILDDNGSIDFDGSKFVCKAGTEITLEFSPDYKVDEITIGGKEQVLDYMYGEYTFIAVEDAEIHIAAHPYGDISFSININNPAGINIYDGYYYMDKLIELTEGHNEVKIAETEDPMISFVLNDGYYVNSITDAEGNEYKNQQSVYVTEGMELTFDIAEYVLDQKAVVFIDDITAYQYFFSFMNSAHREINGLKTGYNVMEYAEAYNPFYLSWGPATTSYGVYVNDEEQTPNYPNTATYNVEIPDASVVKLFLKEVPARCSVSFEAAASCEAVVTRDLIVPVTDLSAGFECFAGTEISVAAGNDAVKINGEAVTPDADGVCTFIVAADTKVSIGDAAGIADVMVEGANYDDSVYNLQGVKVGTVSEMNTLPAGLYISNGKKVVVK